jgi:hypothetical protein
VFTELLTGNVLIKPVTVLSGTSFRVFDIPSTIIETDALLILPVGVFIQ